MMETRRVPAIQLTLILAAFAGLNILVAFVAQGFVLFVLGPGIETDALFAGMAVPNFFVAILSGLLARVLVPLLTVEDDDNRCAAATGLLLIAGTTFAILSAALYVLAPSWIPHFVPGFSEEAKRLTIELTRIQLLGVPFGGSSTVLFACCHARRRFAWAASSAFAANVLGLSLVVWGLPQHGVVIAGWAYVARSAAEFLLLLPGLGGLAAPCIRPRLRREAWRRLRPLLIGTTYYKLGYLADRFFSSMAGPGGLSLYHFSLQIYGAANALIEKAVVAPAVPDMAEDAGRGAWLEYGRRIHRRTIIVGCAAFAAFLLVVFAGPSLAGKVVGHGGITAQNISTLWWILVALVGHLVGGAIGLPLAAAFDAMGDTRSPMIVGALGFSLGLPVKAVCLWLFGIPGLALASSLQLTFNAALLYVLVRKRLRALPPMAIEAVDRTHA